MVVSESNAGSVAPLKHLIKSCCQMRGIRGKYLGLEFSELPFLFVFPPEDIFPPLATQVPALDGEF